MAEEYLNYDENVDHLVIHKVHEQIARNVDTGFVIISLNAKQEIVGLEFMGAHRNFHIPLEVLKNMSGCIVEIFFHRSLTGGVNLF